MKKVYISTTSFASDDEQPLQLLKAASLDIHMNPLGRKMSENEMINVLADMDYLIAGTEPLTRRVLASTKKLKVISRCGVGMDNVDLGAAAELGIKVFNTPWGPTVAVAELTVGLILDLLRKCSAMDRAVRAGVWKKQMGRLLNGKKVGIIGFGRIGQKVASLLLPFNVELSYCDICEPGKSLSCSPRQTEDLLSWADIVTLHCSAPETMPLLGKLELEKMKKGSWIVNASRGGLIDEGALYRVIKEGHIAGAALDVFDQEPYAGPLRELDNVILTPHIGSYAKEARIQMEMDSVDNLLKAAVSAS